jgi:hypothetical protein
MDSGDVTVEVLREIRDEVRATNTRLDALRHDTNTRFERLERRQTESEVRLATELVAVTGAVREVRDLLREGRAASERLEDHERRIVSLERRGAQ